MIGAAEQPWLSAVIERGLGLAFGPDRWDDLLRGLRAAADDLGLPSAEELVESLRHAPPDAAQLQALANHLTVGETYFLRDTATLDVMRRRVLPPLVAARRDHSRHLRLWSAACCSGEEAITLAMLLHEELDDLPSWQVTLLGTDVNSYALARARAGVYSQWSFRGVSDEVRSRHFERLPSGQHAVKPHLAGLVKWSTLNLVSDHYPSLHTSTLAMDIIFCRNVLMYFAPEQAKRAVDKLYNALNDGGWLVVSPVEAASSYLSQFRPVQFEGVTLHRREPRSLAPDFPPPPRPRPVRERLSPAPVVPPAPARPPVAPPAASDEPVAEEALEAAELERRVRAYADRGLAEQACEWGRRLVAAAPLDALAHYLLALVLLEHGARDEAERSLRDSLYLEPDLVMAHWQLANLARADGHTHEAARHLRRVLLLLADCPLQAPVPVGEGLTAGRLGELAQSLL